MTNQNSVYDDIIDLPHHVSKTHPRMSRHDRAAQFSPFAALTGYDEAVEEAARLTDSRIIPDEDRADRLDRTMRVILENMNKHPQIRVTYFIPDDRKNGGKYTKYIGRVRTFNEYDKMLIFEDGKKIAINDIYELEFSQK